MNSRAKGARGERDAAAAWAKLFGWARRGQQFAGGTESPDIVTCTPGVHVEVKRTERGNPYSWLKQAISDAGPRCPLVMHRRNNEEWIVIVRLSDVPRLAKELGGAAAAVGGDAVPPALPSTCVPAPIR